MAAAATGRGNAWQEKRKILVAGINSGKLRRQRLSTFGEDKRGILTILLGYADGRRLITMNRKRLNIERTEVVCMQTGRIVQMHPGTLLYTESMGVQQGRKALQQRQQYDKEKAVAAPGHEEMSI
jgi:hypothetical protein